MTAAQAAAIQQKEKPLEKAEPPLYSGAFLTGNLSSSMEDSTPKLSVYGKNSVQYSDSGKPEAKLRTKSSSKEHMLSSILGVLVKTPNRLI